MNLANLAKLRLYRLTLIDRRNRAIAARKSSARTESELIRVTTRIVKAESKLRVAA